MAAGGSSFIRNFGVRLVVLEGDSFTQATRQVVQANQAQANSLRSLTQAQRAASGESGVMVGRLRELAANIAILDGPLGGVASRVNAFATSISRAGLITVGFGVTVAGVILVLRRALPVISEYQVSMARMEGVVRATGGQLGLTAQQMEGFSQQIAGDTLANLTEVRQAFAELSTSGVVFGDTAVRTIRVSQDLAQVFGGTLAQNMDLLVRAAIKVESGVEGFRERFGVAIPAALQNSIKAMQELGDTQGAMDALLQFLESRVGGQGAAATEGLAGAFDQLQESVQNAFESLSGYSFIEALEQSLRGLATTIDDLVGIVQDVYARGGIIQLLLGPAESELRTAIAQIESLVGLIDVSLARLGGLQETVNRLQEGGLPGLVGRLRGTISEGFGIEALKGVGEDLGKSLGESMQRGLEAAGLAEALAPAQRVFDEFFAAQGTAEQKILQTLTQELELEGEVAAAKTDRLEAEAQHRNRIAAIAAADLETEIQRREQAEKAADAAQRQLAIDAERKRLAEAAEKAAKAAAQLEEQRQQKQIQELLRIENVIEGLEARLIDLQEGSTFEQIKAKEGGTTAFLLSEDEIKFKADQIDARKREEEAFKAAEERIKAQAEAAYERTREQRAATRELAQTVSGELVNAWRSVTTAIIEGTDVAKAAVDALLNSALNAATQVTTQLIASGIAGGLQAASPGFAAGAARFFTFAQGGQFDAATGGGSSVVHLRHPPGPGIFAGRAQRGLDFMVPGAGAADSVPVSFLASPGERVTVARPGEGGGNINLNINAPGATPDTVEMLRTYGEGLIEQAVGRSVGRMMDLATRDRTVRRTLGRGRR